MAARGARAAAGNAGDRVSQRRIVEAIWSEANEQFCALHD
jgi:hypothetical protein